MSSLMEDQREYLETFGVKLHDFEIWNILDKLKEYAVVVMDSDDEPDFLYIEYSIVFNMRTKILIDRIFEDSKGYMLHARDTWENGKMLLNISELMNVYY